MSRVLRAGTTPGPVADVERPASRGYQLHDLPSGLASLVLHFTALIILGLVVTEAQRPHLSEVIVNWEEPGDNPLAGGGGGNDGLDEIDQPAKLEPDLTEANESLASTVPDAEPLLTETSLTTESEWGEVEADIVPSLASSDALADMAAMSDLGLRSSGTGGGSGGGRGRGHGPGVGDGIGPGSATGVFGLRDEASRIVYVFDRSESMNSVFTLNTGSENVSVTFLEAAKEELTKSVGELTVGSEFHMIFYNSVAAPFIEGRKSLVKVDNETKEVANQFIYNLVAGLNTNHVAALEMALDLKPEVIFLMTDGEEKDDPTSSDLRRLQKLARRSGTRINVIHFCFEERPNSSLASLAKRTQGQFKSIHIRSLIDPEW
jgi:hypothetical protein